MKWTVPMPAKQPDENIVFVRMGIKTYRQRAEFDGGVPYEKALRIWKDLCRKQAEGQDDAIAAYFPRPCGTT